MKSSWPARRFSRLVESDDFPEVVAEVGGEIGIGEPAELLDGGFQAGPTRPGPLRG